MMSQGLTDYVSYIISPPQSSYRAFRSCLCAFFSKNVLTYQLIRSQCRSLSAVIRSSGSWASRWTNTYKTWHADLQNVQRFGLSLSTCLENKSSDKAPTSILPSRFAKRILVSKCKCTASPGFWLNLVQSWPKLSCARLLSVVLVLPCVTSFQIFHPPPRPVESLTIIKFPFVYM